ncbi:AI-2E family transporter [Novosphingobium aerophilum]|uniref:AI-2E family transporter n=1 Tax=Novosphingobium TaxID=165696 RepID=UPI0006C8A444|nr:MULTISPECIES: AI-2E family transporter [unclassified Novosphingobium]KPH66813.1 membrane protein [Novosphingobium sp. ST904]TCM38096.1 putative PurR-regulated permease PerM [Novosphingobium sp. ST904]WRT92371.1 AI-2E family transporter [Novosphingobium sp. RL4]
MEQPERPPYTIEDYGFGVLVILVTAAFAWLLLPYFGAVLWGVVAAILFQPLTARLATHLGGRKNLAAGLMLLMLLAIFIIPTLLLGASLVQEVSTIYEKVRDGQINVPHMLEQFRAALPDSLERMIDRYGLTDFENLRRQFGAGIANGLQGLAARLLSVGQGALSFLAALGVMLYLTFFLLRDGDRYGALIRDAMPLRPHLRDRLVSNFIVVVRATMKGTVVVAVAQGVVGGTIFSLLGIEGSLLWGVMMGFFSLLPAVGTGLVWVPMAGYLFATGQVWQGAVLAFCGMFIIGMIDNILRPILVGRDTRMPDFVVLIATLAGLQIFGLNGFIVGPVIAALFIAVWNLMREIKNSDGLLEPDAIDIEEVEVEERQAESPSSEAEVAAHPS